MRPRLHIDHPLASDWRHTWRAMLPPSICFDDGGDDASGGSGGGSSDDDQLGEGGQKALAAERARARQAEKDAKEARERADAAEKRAKQLEDANASDTEKAMAKAREEAAEAARAEEREKAATATMAATRRILTSEVKAAAGTKLADPNDAVRLLDLDQFEPGDDGEFDAKAISAAIDKLLKDKPYLAAKASGTNGSGGFDGGAREESGGGGMEGGRERARKEREQRDAKSRDPFAGMTVAGQSAGTTQQH